MRTIDISTDVVTRNRVLVYHKVDKKVELGLTRVVPSQFKRQVEHLIARGYKLVTLSDLLSKYDSDSSAIAITFDNGYKDVYEFAFPILKQYGAVVTVFVISSYIGKYNLWDSNLGWIRFQHLNENEIGDLISEGWEIGSHGVIHCCLNGVLREKLEYEVRESKRYIEDIFDITVSYFSSPFGKMAPEILRTVLKVGYEGVCGFYPFRCLKKQLRYGEIARLTVYLFDSLKSIDRKLSFGYGLKGEVLKQNIINFCSNATILVKSLK